jgi:hypothetical protein
LRNLKFPHPIPLPWGRGMGEGSLEIGFCNLKKLRNARRKNGNNLLFFF